MALSKTNFYLLIDGSASMDKPAGTGYSGTRWAVVEEVASSLATWLAGNGPDGKPRDPDGIDIVVFQGNGISTFRNQRDNVAVGRIFESETPFGGTPLHKALEFVVDDFVGQKEEVAPTFAIVLTDGWPSNDEEPVRQLKRAADFMKSRGLTDEAFAVWFIQVGEDSQGTAYLKWLDSDDEDGKGAQIRTVLGYDLVDVTPIDKVKPPIENMIIAAING